MSNDCMDLEQAKKTLRQMRTKYGDFVDSVPLLELNPRNVPENLVAYLPYAALWGIADDMERELLIENAPIEAKEDLANTVMAIDDLLDDWLAGNDSQSEDPTKEYVAYSAMRMAADFI